MKHTIKTILLFLLFGGCLVGVLRADEVMQKEYQIKTALIYNFLKFIDWPEVEDDEGSNDSSFLTVGLYASEEIYKVCRSIEGKKVKDRKIRIQKVFAEDLEFENSDIWKTIDVLFLTESSLEEEEIKTSKVLGLVKGRSILTISEVPKFIEEGGIINFVRDDNHVKFEINLDAAKEARLEIKTSLLKLAKTVVQKKK
ncbi:MAG: YfiR family protein [Planctomycetes bacterium]|nr:YfiR family protein [Planctomycetota bacterium]